MADKDEVAVYPGEVAQTLDEVATLLRRHMAQFPGDQQKKKHILVAAAIGILWKDLQKMPGFSTKEFNELVDDVHEILGHHIDAFNLIN